MSETSETIQELIKTGIKEIKEKSINTENILADTESSLMEQKKAIVKKYIEKNIDDPILELTGVAEDYLITNNFLDKIKDKLIYEKFLEKSNIKKTTIDEMKKLKDDLEKAKETDSLKNIENSYIDNIDLNEQKPIEQNESTTPEPDIQTENEFLEQIAGNDAISEKYKNYINKISSKFSDQKKANITKFGPVVVQEALKNKETKTIIPKIFAQIDKESGRNPNALNDKGEYSIGFMQINKKAGHTGKINGKYYDLNKPEGNIAYGISFLAECIKRSNGNIRRGFNIYNGGANLSKKEKDQYAHSIMNDKLFNEKLVA